LKFEGEGLKYSLFRQQWAESGPGFVDFFHDSGPRFMNEATVKCIVEIYPGRLHPCLALSRTAGGLWRLKIQEGVSPISLFSASNAQAA
jgi:hypothetical protein